jgi:hypothetical protein
MQSTLNILYSTIKSKKKKERFETILEPLQAILQIGYLSFSPIGTKLTIRNNILQIQTPNYSQSVIRWYNNDTQEDLFYLFNIFYRFKKFYHFLNDDKINHESKKLYDLLIELAKNGINNLIRTYSQTDKIHILHTLQLYKNILEGGNNIDMFGNKRLETFEIDHFSNSPASQAPRSVPASFSSNTKNKNTKHKQQILRDNDSDEEKNNDTKCNGNQMQQLHSQQQQQQQQSQSQDIKNIDDVFIRITDIYTQEIYNIIYNTLLVMGNNEQSHDIYIDGLNKILEPTNQRIKKWIDENIVF